MADKNIRESTLSFQFNSQDYEAAREHPTLYRTLNRAPRSEHPFNIYDDIKRQPELVAETLQTFQNVASNMADEIVGRGLRRILLTGIGASYHLAASAAHALWNLSGFQVEYVDSAEAILSHIEYDYRDMAVIGLSASGNTIEAVEHLRMCREAGAYTLAFVNFDSTRLTEVAHTCYAAPGGFGLVWDYTTRLAALNLLAIELGKKNGRSSESLGHVEGALFDLPSQMTHTLDTIDDLCCSIGSEIQPKRAIVIPASGNQLPTAWETALRFEEMAHFPARGRSLVDFLHGGVGYLAPDIITLLPAQPGETYKFALRAARVTQTVKTPCYAILDQDDDGGVAELVDGVIRVASTHPQIQPLLYILPGQLLPYYTEVSRPGGNPDIQRTDQPRYARGFDLAMPPKSH
jgi:glucosamine--fructose-6-phosphate aminotransferase (isomerizing)